MSLCQPIMIPQVYTPQVYIPQVYIPQIYNPQVHNPQVYILFRNKTLFFFKIESWNFQHTPRKKTNHLKASLKLLEKSQFVEPKQKLEEKMLLNKNDLNWKTLPSQEIKLIILKPPWRDSFWMHSTLIPQSWLSW